MPRVVSVDAAIRDNMPYVEFRGRFYQLRDFTIREQVEQVLEFRERQEEAEAEQAAAVEAVRRAEAEERESEEADIETLRANAERSILQMQEVYGEAFSRALVDFPAELAESMTQREIEVLQAAIQEARETTFPVDARTVAELDPKAVGRATG